MEVWYLNHTSFLPFPSISTLQVRSYLQLLTHTISLIFLCPCTAVNVIKNIVIWTKKSKTKKNATAIDESKVDWKQLDDLGLSRERLEQGGELEKMLNWQKTNLVTIAVPIGDTTIYTEARLAFRTDDNGNIGLAIHPLRKEPQLDFPYMGYKFSPEEKEALLATGNLGKTIEVTPKNAEPFSAYVSIDPQTNEIIALRADRVNIPKEIKGVTLSDAQYKDLVEGKAVKVEGMTAKSGKSFNATLQVNAEKKGIEFIFDNNRGFKERQQQTQQQGVPHKLCGLELSEKQREALDSGRTLYLKNMVDKPGTTFQRIRPTWTRNRTAHAFINGIPTRSRKPARKRWLP